MTTVANTGSTSDPYPPSRFDMVGHWTGDTFVVPPPTAPAGSAAPVSAAPTRPAGPDSGWTGGRMVVLVPGSLLGLAALERRRHTGIAIGLLAGGVVLLAGGAVLVILAARSAGDGR